MADTPSTTPASSGAAIVANLCVGLFVAGLDFAAALLAAGFERPPLRGLVQDAAAAGLTGFLLAAFADRLLVATLARMPRAMTLSRGAFGGALVGLAGAPALAAFLAAVPHPGSPSLMGTLAVVAAAAAVGALSCSFPRLSLRGALAALTAAPLLLALLIVTVWLKRFETGMGVPAKFAIPLALAGAAAVLVAASTRRARARSPALLLGALLLAPAAWAYWPQPSEGQAPAPSTRHPVRRVLLIVVDTLRADALSYASPNAPPTPAIDALARESVVYTRAYAAAPWTLPSMVTLLSGLPPEAHGVLKEGLRVPSRVPLLAEHMREEGYRTAGFSRNAVLFPRTEIGRGLDEYACLEPRRPSTPLGGWLRSLRRADPRARLASDQALTSTALEWIRRQKDQDFFLWLQYYDPHGPYEPREDMTRDGHARWGARSALRDIAQGLLVPGVEQRAWIRDLYSAEVRQTDRQIGRLMDGLRELGILEDTLIVLTSDHGEEFFEHEGVEHGHSLYAELLRVPLLVRLPRDVGQRRSFDQPVSLSQVPATIFELCGLNRDSNQWPEEPLLRVDGSPVPPPEVVGSTGLLRFEDRTALVFGDVKYIRHHVDAREELFDLAADPQELAPLAASDPRYDGWIARGRELLEARRSGARALKTRLGLELPGTVDIEEATRQMLRDLGYAQ
jgi:arylsulfatase A-like enzyme